LECFLTSRSARPAPAEPNVRESKVTVKIPRPLYRKVQLVVEGSGFNSPTDFIVYVLRDLMGEAEEHPRELIQEELDDVKRKLRNLGYL
jgi:Arc/MetJ-type ribon-helix-helix transcriptional regulator